jgi:CheY-like chemotaxis protein
MSRRLLLIENQVTQFEKIRGSLSSYEIFPDIPGYPLFIDKVRVYVTKNYPESLRTKMLDELVSQIDAWKIELMIIDLRLVGTTQSMTGIGLASAIEAKSGSARPIIFLSGTAKHNEEIESELKIITRYEWVEKGYGAISILEKEYLKNHLMPAIERLLGTSEFDHLCGQLRTLIEIPVLKDHQLALRNLEAHAKEIAYFSTAEKELIIDLHGNCLKYGATKLNRRIREVLY